MSFRPRGKFGAKRVETDGYSFASKLEAAVYQMLKFRLAAGEFSEIRCQVQVSLSAAQIIYRPDFECITKYGSSFYCEAKGYETPEWRIKRRLWIAYGPGKLEVWAGSHTSPRLKEVLEPKEEL